MARTVPTLTLTCWARGCPPRALRPAPRCRRRSTGTRRRWRRCWGPAQRWTARSPVGGPPSSSPPRPDRGARRPDPSKAHPLSHKRRTEPVGSVLSLRWLVLRLLAPSRHSGRPPAAPHGRGAGAPAGRGTGGDHSGRRVDAADAGGPGNGSSTRHDPFCGVRVPWARGAAEGGHAEVSEVLLAAARPP